MPISREAVVKILNDLMPWGNASDDWAAKCLEMAVTKVKEMPDEQSFATVGLPNFGRCCALTPPPAEIRQCVRIASRLVSIGIYPEQEGRFSPSVPLCEECSKRPLRWTPEGRAYLL